ncbi:MAG: glycerate kinase [Clostridia bacterium]|nr:glycerate kinase [Clostridia bacterium]
MLREDAKEIYTYAINQSLPKQAVSKALESFEPDGKIYLVAIGKASWQMAKYAYDILKERITKGIVITKYGHSLGDISNFDIYEAAHPVPDENTLRATNAVLNLTNELDERDTVLFLVSGGGSALFESVDCSLDQLQGITSELLASGASIDEINVIRKHLSNVKGGRFAEHCMPARVYTVLLSDVLGDRLDTIASGPSVPDASTVDDVKNILEKYGISIETEMRKLLSRETPKRINNSTYYIGGSVRELCKYAMEKARALGYKTELLTDNMSCEASKAGCYLADIAKKNKDTNIPLAFVAGGETVVKLKGNGKGGRNQEIALSAAIELQGIDNVAIFSVGSDGTDGPTDAAGGYADGNTVKALTQKSVDAHEMLLNNDSYNALMECDGLIFTGPTGTNVNDVSVILIRPANI